MGPAVAGRAHARIGELEEPGSNLRKIGAGLSTIEFTIVSQWVANL